MLNYPNVEWFFSNCLSEVGLDEVRLSFKEVQADPTQRQRLLKTLRDIQSGSDAVLAKGKPAEDTLGLSMSEWEQRWAAWAASRKAAFFSRAACLLLGEAEFATYFIQILRTSHNLVFLSAANDVLQHWSGRYLSGPEEDFSNAQLTAWWEARL